MIHRFIVRRSVLRAGGALLVGPWLALLGAGCASKSKNSKSKNKSAKSRSKRKDNRDPSRFGSMLMDSYVSDLETGPASKQVTAARQLANMGPKAKSALPLLEKLAKSSDDSVSQAAKAAVAAIRKAKK